MAAAPQFAKVQYALIPLGGGLDQVTPTLSLKPGVAREAVNFEASITGGYTRIAGYERFDGRPAPSSAGYGTLTVEITGAIAAGDTITSWPASGGSLELEFTAGSYATWTPVTALVLAVFGTTVVYTKSTGIFGIGEYLSVGGAIVGSITEPAASVTVQQAAQYQALAANAYRSDIGVVPGSGPIRGVAYYGGTVYAWRDNVGATALAMYQSSSTGWQAVSLGVELAFATGTAIITAGQTVTGATSGASGVVTRVVLQSGDWTTSDAAGRLIFASVTGTFQNGENLQVAAATKAVSGGAQAAITLAPGGRVETVIANFGGAVNSTRLYGCDGQNRAFEFDGTVYVPISTGMTVDKPTHIAFHKQHLFLSFGNSVQFSSIGDPYSWSPVLGAGEIALIDNVTAFLVQPGDQSTGAMAIYSDSNTFILYGSSEANFNLVSYNVGTGAKAYSAQNINQSYVFDDRGVISLQTTLNYGNFDSSALTLNIRPFVQQRRNLITASGVNREKGQYRLFFSDGSGLYLTFVNGQMMGAMPVEFPNPATCMCEGEKPDGSETAFFGSTSGYVYRLDSGASFDGQDISAAMTLVFNAIGTPRAIKRFRRASLEITGESFAEFAFGYDLGYGSTEYEQGTSRSYSTSLVASFWDSVVWDSFVWDGRTLAPSEVEMEGSAENVAVRVASVSALYQPFTVNSVILHYSARRGLR